MRAASFVGIALVFAACGKKSDAPAPTPVGVGPAGSAAVGSGSASATRAGSAAPVAEPARAEVERVELNRLAVRLDLPIYWVADTNGNNSVDRDEVVSLLFYPTPSVDLDTAYQRILAQKGVPVPDAALPEGKRRKLVGDDLDGGRATLVLTDATAFTPAERGFLDRMLAVATKIDALYATQLGLAHLAEKLPGDPESHSLFRRNWGPACVAPGVESDPACTAIAGMSKPPVDVYPTTVDGVAQGSAKFCEALEKRKDADALLAPFTVVRAADGGLAAVSYSEAYAAQMTAIADELVGAAGALDASEAALAAYLQAAATAFRTNDWWPADEAWAKMNADNSKWYVRVGPDETYWEPCSHKAGFHLTFARIDPASKAWQAKLAPVQNDMEAAIAARAGAPYTARAVTFKLPDFIDIVVNAGDDRAPISATIGQSLPNFGPVKDENRSRTVVMANLFTDDDSLARAHTAAASLLDAAAMKTYADDPHGDLAATILHEATHNLGPNGGYQVRGKTSEQVFGGPVSTVMEELKAQTGALFLVELLRQKGILTDAAAAESYTGDLTWMLGQISRGMYESDGSRKTYSQLAAIQLGFLIDQGAVVWDAKATAANGTDTGAFVVHLDKLPAAAAELMSIVAGAMARGDKPAAMALVKKYVDGKVVPFAVIAERYRRVPKASLVYAIRR